MELLHLVNGRQLMKPTSEDLERLERNTRQFLQLMKRGDYQGARLTAGLLEAATYTLDATWMKGYAARMELKA